MATAQLAPMAASFKVDKVAVKFLFWSLPALAFALQADRIINGLCRPFWGWVSDHTGREPAMGIAFALYGGMLDGMEPEFSAFFRWASLLLTVPSLIWGGGVFFRSAWSALSARTLGMDLPISLGLLAGFFEGWPGAVLMRIADVQLHVAVRLRLEELVDRVVAPHKGFHDRGHSTDGSHPEVEN